MPELELCDSCGIDKGKCILRVDIKGPTVVSSKVTACGYWRPKENKRLYAVLKECDNYLSPNKLNSICCGSILHRQIKQVLKEDCDED